MHPNSRAISYKRRGENYPHLIIYRSGIRALKHCAALERDKAVTWLAIMAPVEDVCGYAWREAIRFKGSPPTDYLETDPQGLAVVCAALERDKAVTWLAIMAPVEDIYGYAWREAVRFKGNLPTDYLETDPQGLAVVPLMHGESDV